MAFRLPPPPTSGHNQQQQNLAPQSILDNYLNLRNSYINMINTKDTDHEMSAAVDPAAPALVPPPTAVAAASANPSFEASPFVPDQNDMNSFRELLELCGMTPDGTPALQNFDGSPIEETPLFTPVLDMLSTPYLDGWEQSPATGDMDSFDPLPPLFYIPKKSTNQNETHNNTIADPTELFTLPHTPALAPTALMSEESAAHHARNNKAGPTGFRKGMDPTNMVPMDAPTQPRQYLSNSKTSRKDVPAAFQNKARKRKHDEDEDDIPDDIQDAIAAKRRLNTLAARRSRARKAQTAIENEQRLDEMQSQMEHLQQELVRVTAERDTYRAQLGLM